MFRIKTEIQEMNTFFKNHENDSLDFPMSDPLKNKANKKAFY